MQLWNTRVIYIHIFYITMEYCAMFIRFKKKKKGCCNPLFISLPHLNIVHKKYNSRQKYFKFGWPTPQEVHFFAFAPSAGNGRFWTMQICMSVMYHFEQSQLRGEKTKNIYSCWSHSSAVEVVCSCQCIVQNAPL